MCVYQKICLKCSQQIKKKIIKVTQSGNNPNIHGYGNDEMNCNTFILWTVSHCCCGYYCTVLMGNKEVDTSTSCE